MTNMKIFKVYIDKLIINNLHILSSLHLFT